MPPKSKEPMGRAQVRARDSVYAVLIDRSCTEGDGDEWGGVHNEPEEAEEEYEGEEQLATVTVVQDFDLTTLIHGPAVTRGSGRKREEKKEAKVGRRSTGKVKYRR